MQYFVYKKEKL